jgi:hypothetical protein
LTPTEPKIEGKLQGNQDPKLEPKSGTLKQGPELEVEVASPSVKHTSAQRSPSLTQQEPESNNYDQEVDSQNSFVSDEDFIE